MKNNDKKRQAIASFILGLIGLAAWYIPLIGFPVCFAGFIMGVAGRKSSKKTMATAGFVMSLIGMVASVANSTYGLILARSGKLF